jgi:hypothetical protein
MLHIGVFWNVNALFVRSLNPVSYAMKVLSLGECVQIFSLAVHSSDLAKRSVECAPRNELNCFDGNKVSEHSTY